MPFGNSMDTFHGVLHGFSYELRLLAQIGFFCTISILYVCAVCVTVPLFALASEGAVQTTYSNCIVIRFETSSCHVRRVSSSHEPEWDFVVEWLINLANVFLLISYKNSLLKYIYSLSTLVTAYCIRRTYAMGKNNGKVCDLSLLRSHGGSSKKSTFARVIYWNGITFTRVGGWRLQPLSLHCSLQSSRQTHNNDMLTFEFSCVSSVCVFVLYSVIIVALLHAMNVLSKAIRISSCMFDAVFVQIDVQCAQKTWKITRNGFFHGTQQRQHRRRQRRKIKQNAMSNLTKIIFFSLQTQRTS